MANGDVDGFRRPVVDRMLLEVMADVTYLALVLWREARGETYAARLAVACSVMNRVNRPSWWGSSVMSVVLKKWQYSSMTDPKDRQLTTWPNENDSIWWECMQTAYDVLNKVVGNPAPGADSYYDVSIPPPKWATPETFVVALGRLRFHNLDRDVEANPQ